MTKTQPVDVAIITVKHEEYEAVHGRLREAKDEPGTGDAPNLYGWETGWIDRADRRGAYRVVLAVVGRATSVPASQAIVATVQRWRPRYVLLVGIAGGLAREQCALGDVVVSSVIHGYEYGKLEETYRVRPRGYDPDPALLASVTRFIAVHGDWGAAFGGTPPKALIGPVASGDKIIDDPTHELFAAVERAFPGLQAVEMEGAGAAGAIQFLHATGVTVGFAMVRGISDMPKPGASGAQKDERDRNVRRACASAAQFTVRWIAESWPVLPAGPATTGPPSGTASASSGASVVATAATPVARVTSPVRFDLFLAHAAGDKQSARTLYQLLQPDITVFLDEITLMLGDRWDKEIPAAQRASRATVVLVSPRCDPAWYLGAEVVAAIAMHRAAPDEHRLIPVLLEPTGDVPYGLAVVQAIDSAAVGGLTGVAARLRDVVARLRGLPAAAR